VNKLSVLFRKRALLGVGVFCVAAIVTVGALSTGRNNGEEDPEQLVDLNDQTPSDADKQVADGTDKTNEEDIKNPQVADGMQNPDSGKEPQQVADGTDGTKVPEDGKIPEDEGDGKDSQQVADGTQKPEEGKSSETTGDKQQVADKTETPKTDNDTQQVAGGSGKGDNEQGTEVLSPQMIAERLTYNKASGLQWPVQGNILIPYSPDHGVYYETLDQFATSDAVVIASSVGEEVLAAAKGVVVSIEEDVRTGMTVTLALGNNTQLIYGQLEPGNLKVGDILEEGECIGTVATPTRYYSMEGANLYFQVMEGAQSINPTELLR